MATSLARRLIHMPIFARRLSTQVKLNPNAPEHCEIAISLASRTLELPLLSEISKAKESAGINTEVTRMSEKLPKKELDRFSPDELSELAKYLLGNSNAVFMPGSKNTIPEALYKKDESLITSQNKSDVKRWLLKIAIAKNAIEFGLPLIASCESMGVLTLLSGGKLGKVSDIIPKTIPGIISDPDDEIVHSRFPHDIIIPKGSAAKENWLYEMSLRSTQIKPCDDGNIIIPDVLSTHPLYSSFEGLSEDAESKVKILAYSPDGTPSIVQYCSLGEYVLGIQDHIEGFNSSTIDINHSYDLIGESPKLGGSGVYKGSPSTNLWDATLEAFVKAAKMNSPKDNSLLAISTDKWFEEVCYSARF